jgi:translation initiation factor IF-2
LTGTKRVYELAKEMGLENKELLSKLEKAGVEGKSHSSTLTEDELSALAQSKGSAEETIEESRIKPGIIRRRRTVVNTPEPELEVEPEVVSAPETEPVPAPVEAVKVEVSAAEKSVTAKSKPLEPELPAPAVSKVDAEAVVPPKSATGAEQIGAGRTQDR